MFETISMTVIRPSDLSYCGRLRFVKQKVRHGRYAKSSSIPLRHTPFINNDYLAGDIYLSI